MGVCITRDVKMMGSFRVFATTFRNPMRQALNAQFLVEQAFACQAPISLRGRLPQDLQTPCYSQILPFSGEDNETVCISSHMLCNDLIQRLQMLEL